MTAAIRPAECGIAASVGRLHDLAIVLVSHHGKRWLEPCLRSVYANAGDCSLEVVVVANSDDGTDALVAERFPAARVVRCENRGFAHANNRGLETCAARYVLFLNVDTEIVDGTLAELVRALDERPAVGAAGVRQLTTDGALAPTIRRFPSALRTLADALGCERWPIRSWALGERELRRDLYGRETSCDWASGSFLVIRAEALRAVGTLDERFFLYSEEPDLCLRIRRAGWDVRHLPVMTIVHHGGSDGTTPRFVAQDAHARIQFAHKHFSRPHRVAYRASLAVLYGLRAVRGRRCAAARAALRVVVGIGPAPFAGKSGSGRR